MKKGQGFDKRGMPIVGAIWVDEASTDPEKATYAVSSYNEVVDEITLINVNTGKKLYVKRVYLGNSKDWSLDSVPVPADIAQLKVGQIWSHKVNQPEEKLKIERVTDGDIFFRNQNGVSLCMDHKGFLKNQANWNLEEAPKKTPAPSAVIKPGQVWTWEGHGPEYQRMVLQKMAAGRCNFVCHDGSKEFNFSVRDLYFDLDWKLEMEGPATYGEPTPSLKAAVHEYMKTKAFAEAYDMSAEKLNRVLPMQVPSNALLTKKEVEESFKQPKESNYLIQADYSAIELRILEKQLEAAKKSEIKIVDYCGLIGPTGRHRPLNRPGFYDEMKDATIASTLRRHMTEPFSMDPKLGEGFPIGEVKNYIKEKNPIGGEIQELVKIHSVDEKGNITEFFRVMAKPIFFSFEIDLGSDYEHICKSLCVEPKEEKLEVVPCDPKNRHEHYEQLARDHELAGKFACAKEALKQAQIVMAFDKQYDLEKAAIENGSYMLLSKLNSMPEAEKKSWHMKGLHLFTAMKTAKTFLYTWWSRS